MSFFTRDMCCRRPRFDKVCRNSMSSHEAKIKLSMQVSGYLPWSVKSQFPVQFCVGG